jgi:hypothetical protein
VDATRRWTDAGTLFSDRPAGALLARIGGAPPIYVGDLTTITASAGGRLYLGVNDDHLADNRGEFRMSVEIRRGG